MSHPRLRLPRLTASPPQIRKASHGPMGPPTWPIAAHRHSRESAQTRRISINPPLWPCLLAPQHEPFITWLFSFLSTPIAFRLRSSSQLAAQMRLEAGPTCMEGSASRYFPPRVPEHTHVGELGIAFSHLIHSLQNQSFLICIPCISFSCLLTPATVSWKTQNRGGERKHTCFAPKLRGRKRSPLHC